MTDGLGLKPTPDPPQTYAKITDEVARMQQRQRRITEAQRRYVLADDGLLTTVGALVNGRLMTLDTTAMLSAGRQGSRPGPTSSTPPPTGSATS